MPRQAPPNTIWARKDPRWGEARLEENRLLRAYLFFATKHPKMSRPKFDVFIRFRHAQRQFNDVYWRIGYLISKACGRGKFALEKDALN